MELAVVTTTLPYFQMAVQPFEVDGELGRLRVIDDFDKISLGGRVWVVGPGQRMALVAAMSEAGMSHARLQLMELKEVVRRAGIGRLAEWRDDGLNPPDAEGLARELARGVQRALRVIPGNVGGE